MSSEALRLADELVEEAERRVCHVAMAPASLLKDSASLLRNQVARIAELESGACLSTLLSLLADIREACGDKGERMQPELVEHIRQGFAERDQLRAEVERLRGERMVFVELVRDLLQVVDTIQPHSDEMNEIEMLHALTNRARSAIDGVLRAIEAAKEA